MGDADLTRLCERTTIAVRTLGNPKQVAAWRMGDWAAHRYDDNPEQPYILTLLPIGLCIPIEWCAFEKLDDAVGAMAEIVKLRNSWSVVTQADLTKALEAQIRETAKRHNANSDGPVMMIADADRTTFGKLKRFNDYEHPLKAVAQ